MKKTNITILYNKFMIYILYSGEEKLILKTVVEFQANVFILLHGLSN